MKSLFKPGIILCVVQLITGSSFSQVRKNHSLTDSMKEVKMDTTLRHFKNKAAVRKLYEDILNTGKLELSNQFISEEYTGVRGEKGPRGFAETVNSVRTAFPDIKWTIEDLIAEGNKVVVRWSWKGTNKSSFGGFPPSNKKVTNDAIAIYEFKGDKIIQAWMQSDRLGFLEQIGVITPNSITPQGKK